MVDIAPRSAWSPRHENGDKTLSGLANEIFLHHTVTAQLSPDASVADEAAQMRAIESIGESRFGYGISYNVLIFPSGRAYQGVDFNRRGTHTGGKNSTARSICFAGNYEANEPTAAQLATAAAIVAAGRGRWWTAGAPVRLHRDVKQTSCPGKNIVKHRAAIAGGTVPVVNPVPGVPVPPKDYVQKGDRGAMVVDLQNLLNQVGYGLVVDGVFGDKTEAAVKAYQKSRGLTVDGVAGPRTFAALRGHLGPVAPPAPAPAPVYADCTGLQRAVRAVPDNWWGPDTDKRVNAVRMASNWMHNQHVYGVRYTQAVVGAVADGIWGPKSIAAHDATVRAVQAAVGATVDSKYGPETDGKVNDLRSRSRRP